MYSSSIVEVCRKYGLKIDTFHRSLDQQYIREIIETTPKIKPKVAVYGSASLDVYGTLERLPKLEEAVYIQETGRYPGGMGANVAVALARLGVPTTFVGVIGDDSVGRFLLESICRNGVDVSNVTISDESTSLQTFVLFNPEGGRWLLTLGSPNTAISLTSPNKVHWEAMRESAIVYVGEVFIEVASLIVNFAKNQKKLVVYRPGTPYLRLGIEKIHNVLERADIFILNQVGWSTLQEESEAELETAAALLNYGPSIVILTKGAEGCEVYTRKEQFEMPLSLSLRTRFKVVDPTGAGDSFSAGLIKGLLEGWNLRKAISYGQAAAAITCSRVGGMPSFPTAQEVDEVVTH